MSGLDDEKKFYQRFWALHGDPVLTSIFARFGAEPFRRSSVLEGLSDFIAARRFSGRRCVEIGSWKGLTAIVLARHFDEVISVDVVSDPERDVIAQAAGVANVRFVTVTDNAEKARFIAALDFDAAYVDGDHARDTDTDFALVRGCGRVLFHEYWKEQMPVWRLVNSLRSQGRVAVSGKFALWTR